MINKDNILSNCILSSLAHAIMTNIYPDLSYEQSWDNRNFSVIAENERCTISFADEFCVGAIRNEISDAQFIGMESAKELINHFPDEVIAYAESETFLYLLEDVDGKSVPVISCAFYADEKGIYFSDNFNFENSSYLLSETDNVIDYLYTYYEMDSGAKELLDELFEIKRKNPIKSFSLTKRQQQKIPGKVICDECIELFMEMGIVI